MAYPVKITSLSHLTHDVLRIVTEKPPQIQYVPGQAVDVTIDKEPWREEKRPFTFTSLPTESFLEFTIKTYPSHQGVTNQLLGLVPGDRLILHDVFGDIHYKGTGIFIAGGAGITPFLAILRSLQAQHKVDGNKLLFANKTKDDIIHKEEFEKLLGDHFVNVLSGDDSPGFEHGFITAALIQKHITPQTKYFYICGPDPMMDAMEKQLATLGVSADSIVRESF